MRRPIRFWVSECHYCLDFVRRTSPAIADDGIFDDMWFGTAASINNGDTREHGVFPSFTVFLDPLDADGAKELGENCRGRAFMRVLP